MVAVSQQREYSEGEEGVGEGGQGEGQGCEGQAGQSAQQLHLRQPVGGGSGAQQLLHQRHG